MRKDLPRDTPVDTPAVAIIEAPDLGPIADAVGPRALARVQQVESLEAAWSAWRELIAARAALLRRSQEERHRLESQGSLLLGAMQAAGTSEGLSPQDPVVLDARRKLAEASEALEVQSSTAAARFDEAIAAARQAIIERVTRQAAVARPHFRLAVRELAQDRRVLHLHRFGPDESVIALFALSGRIPSRYEALFDDSSDDLSREPPVLYPDDGLDGVRPGPLDLVAELRSRTQVWPVKGQLPMELGSTWVRWLARGAVLEAEILDGASFRNVLTRAEAEQITGALLRRKLAGAIELELTRD